MAGNHLNIMMVDPDGSNKKQLTVNAGDNYTPATSPDGRFIVFSSNRTGTLNIWRMNAEDGSELKQLTFGDGDSYPSFSADSQWVFYDNQSSSKITVWKVPIDGGAPQQLTNEYARMPVVSPDNQYMACRYYVENGAPKEIAIIPVQGGLPVRRLPIPGAQFQKVQWIANGRALTYLDMAKGVSNIKSYNPEKDGDYTGMCMPFGLMRSMNAPYPVQIMQSDRYIAFLFEQNTWFHVVPFRAEHTPDPNPTWFGDSIAKWDGDTLVIDTVDFNGYTRLDTRGNPHSDKLHLVQRFTRTNAGQIAHTVTIDDPVFYTKPWTNERTWLLSNGDLIEVAARMVRDCGRKVATVEQAKKILSLDEFTPQPVKPAGAVASA